MIYEEFLEYSRLLTKKDYSVKTIQYGFTWPTYAWVFEQMLAVADAPFVNNNNGRTERATEAFFNMEYTQGRF